MRERLLTSSPWRVALVVLAFHGAWIGAYFATGHEVRDFIKLGPVYVTLSDRSDVIGIDPDYEYPRNRDAEKAGLGYDGQFVYFIAVDPANAHHYIDDPPYRYSRILYPMLARYGGFADPGAIPYAMLIINWIAAGLGTAALAAWLLRRGISPWVALAYGLFPGLILVLERDLTEVLAYSLVAVGVYLFDYGGRRGVIAAAVAFALAALARETTVVFPLLYAGSIIAGRPNASPVSDRSARRRQAAAFGTISLLPIAAWTVFLSVWLGVAETGANDLGPPFVGIFTGEWELARQPVMLLLLALPALLSAAVAVGQLRRPSGRLEALAVLVNVFFIIVIAGEILWTSSYTTLGRASLAIVLAALLLLPYVREREPWTRPVLVTAFVLWLVLAPVAVVYGFTDFRV